MDLSYLSSSLLSSSFFLEIKSNTQKLSSRPLHLGETQEEHYYFNIQFKSSYLFQLYSIIYNKDFKDLQSNQPENEIISQSNKSRIKGKLNKENDKLELYIISKKKKKRKNDFYEKLYFINEKLVDNCTFFKFLVFLYYFTKESEIIINKNIKLPKKYLSWYIIEFVPHLKTFVEQCLDVEYISIRIEAYNNGYSSIKFCIVLEKNQIYEIPNEKVDHMIE